jgi:hypothetical protein
MRIAAPLLSAQVSLSRVRAPRCHRRFSKARLASLAVTG